MNATYLQDIVRTFQTYKKLGDGALAQTTDDDLHARLDAESNSMAIIIKHLAGNLRSRFTDFLTTDLEKPNRDRDGEFEMPERPARDEIVRWWDSSWAIALATLERLTPADLERIVTIRGERFTVVEALNRLATHAAYHVGQIVYLAKHFAGPDWKGLTIPKRRPPATSGGST